MKLLFDLFPVILFFVAYKFAGIFAATAIAIVATAAQIAWLRLRGRQVSTMQWAALGIIAVFGGATLLLQDELFIKWKPTVLYGLAGAAFLISLALGKNLIKAVMKEGGLELPEPVWFKLCVAWGLFFLFKAALNIFVAYNYSTDAWVNFKLFGGMGLMLAFIFAQAFWISRYIPEEQPTGKAKEG